jgi:hypothetical protein
MAYRSFSHIIYPPNVRPRKNVQFKGDDEDKEIINKVKEEFRKELTELLPESDKTIEELSPIIRQKHEKNVRFLRTLGPKDLAELCEIAEEVFRDVKPTRLGTIGTYYVGFLNIPSSYPKEINPSCAVTCVGQIPHPKHDEKWKNCEFVVYWLSGDRKTKRLNKEDSPQEKKALIFYDGDKFSSTPELGDLEFEELGKDGVEEYRLIGYNEKTGVYSDDRSGFIKVKSPTRSAEASRPRRERGRDYDWIKWALVIAVFLLVIFLIFRHRS